MVREIILDYPCGPSVITWVLRSSESFLGEMRERCDDRERVKDSRLMALKAEEGGHEPRKAGGL